MTDGWTRIEKADDGPDRFSVRIAPDFHDGDGILLAARWEGRERAERHASRIEDFVEALVSSLADKTIPENYEPMLVTVYMDRAHYVRLTPGTMELERVGFPHGISVAGFFETKPQAREHGAAIGDELVRILESFGGTLPEGDPLRTNIDRFAKSAKRVSKASQGDADPGRRERLVPDSGTDDPS